MISINNKVYDNVDKRISWGHFNVIKKIDDTVKHIEGEAPIIKFCINDNVLIRIETTYPREWFNELKIDTKIDFLKHISDITYEDSNGWQSLIGGKYECELKKINDNVYNIRVSAKSDELEELEIKIDENINI